VILASPIVVNDTYANYNLHNGTNFLANSEGLGLKETATGIGSNQTFTYKILLGGYMGSDIRTLDGSLSVTLPLTLTVM